MGQRKAASGLLRRRALALAEVVAVYAIIAVVMKLPGKPFRHWQLSHFGHTYLSNLLFLFAPPLLIWAVTRRSPGELGLAFGQLRTQARIGLSGGLTLLLLASWPIGAIELLGTTYRQWFGAVILVFVELGALIAVALAIRRRGDPEAGTGSQREVILFVLSVLAAFIVGAGLFRLSKLASGFVFMFVFVGFGEEFLFRGYFQSRLNKAFGRPFRFCGIPWGPGLIIAAVLFGLLHPLAQHGSRPWAWSLWTAVAGMTFGMLREKSGSIIASAIAHGLFVAPTVFLELIGR